MPYLIIAALLAWGGSPPQQKLPTADEVLRNVVQAFSGVEDFEVTLEGELNMDRLRVPRSKSTMYFKRPDMVHFVSSSFALIPKDAIVPNPALLVERYDAVMAGREELDGRSVFRLSLSAKDPKVRLRQLSVWVDPAHWTVARIESVPYQGRTLTFEFTYELQQSAYWLPVSLKATFGMLEQTPDGNTSNAPSAAPQLEEMQRPPRNGWVLVTYSDYKVNVGLSDSLFVRQSP